LFLAATLFLTIPGDLPAGAGAIATGLAAFNVDTSLVFSLSEEVTLVGVTVVSGATFPLLVEILDFLS